MMRRPETLGIRVLDLICAALHIIPGPPLASFQAGARFVMDRSGTTA